MAKFVEIYVALLDEGVDVWRPVMAAHLHDNVYRIGEQSYDRTGEAWEFEPGDVVVCEMVEYSDGPILVATEKDMSGDGHEQEEEEL